MGADARKAADLAVDAMLVAEARALGVDPGRAAEDGLRKAVSTAKAEQWKRENAAAIQAYNEWVENNELPLREYRDF
jgi:antitoxin CcdA